MLRILRMSTFWLRMTGRIPPLLLLFQSIYSFYTYPIYRPILVLPYTLLFLHSSYFRLGHSYSHFIPSTPLIFIEYRRI